SIEGKIIRKLIEANNPPLDCYLVLMKQLAYRLAAPYKGNMFSIIHKPWFDFSIPYHFNPTDFTPVPNVQIVLFQFTQKQTPLLPTKEKQRYQTFIHQGFGNGLSVYKNLSPRFREKKVMKSLQNLSIRKETKPSQ